MVVESSVGNGLFFAASFAACAARASIVQTVPVIAAAAPITAFRMRNVRRSMFSGSSNSLEKSGNELSFLSEDFLLIMVCWFGVGVSGLVNALITLISLALNCIDITLRACFNIGGVPFIGIDVHGKLETRVHPYQHITKNEFPVSRDSHPD